MWGTEVRLRELFVGELGALETTVKHFVFRYRSPQHWLEVFKTYYGPILKTFGALPTDQQEALTRDLIDLAERFNRADDGSLIAPSEYLEVVLTQRANWHYADRAPNTSSNLQEVNK